MSQISSLVLLMMMAILMVKMMIIIMVMTMIMITIKIMNIEYVCRISLYAIQIKVSSDTNYDFNELICLFIYA